MARSQPKDARPSVLRSAENSTQKALHYVQLMEPSNRLPNARAGTADKFQGQRRAKEMNSYRGDAW
jgi:hypothetical protein